MRKVALVGFLAGSVMAVALTFLGRFVNTGKINLTAPQYMTLAGFASVLWPASIAGECGEPALPSSIPLSVDIGPPVG